MSATTTGRLTATPPGRVIATAVHGRAARGVLGVAIAIAIAEAAARTQLVDRDLLPPISAVLGSAAELAVDGEFLRHMAATLIAWAYGMVLTVAIAVPLGLLLGTVPAANTAVRPLLEFLRPIPSVALIPLALLAVGGDMGTKVTVIVYASAWPVLFNTMYGLRDVDPLAKDTLRTFGFGPLAVLRRVALPSAAPFIVTGIRLAASVALILAVSTELIAGGRHGIGVYITAAGSARNSIELMLAATLWAGAIGLAANALLVRIERSAFRWHTARNGGTK